MRPAYRQAELIGHLATAAMYYAETAADDDKQVRDVFLSKVADALDFISGEADTLAAALAKEFAAT